MNKKLLYALGVLICLAFIAAWFANVQPKQQSTTAPAPLASLRTIQMAGQTLHVTVADTPASQELGLGGRSGLAPNEGMLFVFPQDGKYAFWMKDMHFSIDIIWISSAGRVVYIVPNLSPATYPADFVPPTPARYVLEVSAGFAVAHGVVPGDIVGL